MKTKSIIVQNSAHACWICQRMPYSMQLKMQPAPYNTRYALQHHTHHTRDSGAARSMHHRALFPMASSAADDVPQQCAVQQAACAKATVGAAVA